MMYFLQLSCWPSKIPQSGHDFQFELHLIIKNIINPTSQQTQVPTEEISSFRKDIKYHEISFFPGPVHRKCGDGRSTLDLTINISFPIQEGIFTAKPSLSGPPPGRNASAQPTSPVDPARSPPLAFPEPPGWRDGTGQICFCFKNIRNVNRILKIYGSSNLGS